MNLTRVSSAWVVSLSIAAITAACSSATSPSANRSASPPAASDEAVPYSTWLPTPHASYKAAEVEGTLASDSSGCVRLRAPDGSLIVLLWPAGYVTRTVDGVVEIASPNGTTVAKTGDAFHAGGGYVGRAPAGQRCAPTNGGWEINQDLPK
jgi:hypothetical protein